MNCAPAGFDPARDLPKGFVDFLLPLHRALALRQRELVQKRAAALAAAHQGRLPDYLPPSPAGGAFAPRPPRAGGVQPSFEGPF